MVNGTVYGVMLNDSDQLAAMVTQLAGAPYNGAPRAPVLYIKPRTCITTGGAPVPVPGTFGEVEIAATIGLLFATDLSAGDESVARRAVGAACLALDVTEPHSNYFRPAIPQRCRDGFLPLGRFGAAPGSFSPEISTFVDGRQVHQWSLDRLARSVWSVAAEISSFMTLAAGDVLLVGLPGDAPRAAIGSEVAVRFPGLSTLSTCLVEEAAA
jgi:5-oxopent-3-ene-1,2,5-tricarboxylate decarboxylase/2-hydroxyhepta-2,4-diene-1,7-dioate isomerase